MKNKISKSLIALFAVLCFFTSCKQDATSEPVASATEHAHRDTVEEVKDNLVITSRQFKAAGIELGKSKKQTLPGASKCPQARSATAKPSGISAYVGGIIKTIVLFLGGQFCQKRPDRDDARTPRFPKNPGGLLQCKEQSGFFGTRIPAKKRTDGGKRHFPKKVFSRKPSRDTMWRKVD